MSTETRPPGHVTLPSRRGGQRSYAALLAAVAGVILALGAWLKPEKATAPAPSESDLQRLQESAQRRSLQQLSGYLAGAANRAVRFLVPGERGGAGAVQWEAGRAVAGAAPNVVGGPPLVVTAGTLTELPVRAPTGALATGDWLLAVARQPGQRVAYAHGLLTSVGTTRCGTVPYVEVQTSQPLTPAFVGGALFDLDGRLVAVVGRCEGLPTAVAADSVDAVLRWEVPFTDRLWRQIGLRPAAATPEQAKALGMESGLLVEAVRSGSASERAGLQPGDVLLDAARHPLMDPETLRFLLDAELPVTLTVRRGRQVRSVRLGAETPRSAVPGSTWERTAAGALAVATVEPDSPAARAGLQPGDVLEGPGAQGERLVVRRGDERRLVWVRP